MQSGERKVAFSRPFFGKEEADGAAAAVASGWVVGGPRLAELEQKIAAACGAESVVGVSSWTTGAFLVLKSLGIGPGDEVIVPSLTFIATVNAIVHAGATPVFADVDLATFNIDPADVCTRLTERTRAILPVDQLGLPCEIDAINEIARARGLLVVQDAACSLGSRYKGKPVGSLAPVTVFSLHARKVVTTGEGGMIATDDGELSARLRRQRHQGMSLSDFERHNASPTVFEAYPEVGYNFRMTDIQADVGVAQMNRMGDILGRRRQIAARYVEALKAHPFLIPPFASEHVEPNWQSFQLRIREDSPLTRNEIMQRLHESGIATRRGVMASHLEEPYRGMGSKLPNTEHLANWTFQLPIFPDLGESEVDYVIERLLELGRH